MNGTEMGFILCVGLGVLMFVCGLYGLFKFDQVWYFGVCMLLVITNVIGDVSLYGQIHPLR